VFLASESITDLGGCFDTMAKKLFLKNPEESQVVGNVKR